jgi:hypothetical protein
VPRHFWFLQKFIFNVSDYFPKPILTFDYAIKNSTMHFRLFNVEACVACVAALAALNHNRQAAQQAGFTDVELSKMDEDILKVECQSLTFEQGHRKSPKIDKLRTSTSDHQTTTS